MATGAESAALRKGLPSSPDSEQVILGCCILGPVIDQAVSSLTASDFTTERHRLIFRAMAELHAENLAITDVTVMERLEAHGKLEAAGGLGYICDLTAAMPRFDDIGSYIKIVRDKAERRRTIYAADELAKKAADEALPLAETLNAAQSRLLSVSDGLVHGYPRTPDQVAADYPGGVEAFLDPQKREPGLSTGFLDFDDLIGGLRPGQLIIIAARPAMGKSALGLNMAYNIARGTAGNNGEPVLFFSLEMGAPPLVERLCCGFAGVEMSRFLGGFASKDELARFRGAFESVKDLPLFLEDRTADTLSDIGAKAHRIQFDHNGLGAIFIDYLQLIQTEGRFENRVAEVSSISRGLKRLAMSLGVPIVALCQLNRAAELRADKKPKLADLRESGSIEMDADIVALLFRPEVYAETTDERDKLRGKAILDIAKARNSRTAHIELTFLGRCIRFESRAPDSMWEGQGYPD